MKKSRSTLQRLQRYESRNITYVDPEGDWPAVWERARGCHVWDAAGRKSLDLTAAFGVAAAGHANPRVVAAGRRQMGVLLHAMGDVHPHALKAQLARELSRLTFERWARSAGADSGRRSRSAASMRGKVIFTNSGFEAVEAALKTARLATGRPGVIAFTGGYHGVGYGALNATHRELFREPFRDQLREFGTFVRWPDCGTSRCSCPTRLRCGQLAELEQTLVRAFAEKSISAILAEPAQVRGGVRIPSPEFLPLLRRVATRHGALLILDEIYTGFGRTGRWFACEHTGVVPDLICLGKALTGGFPLSACVGRSDLMDAWPPSRGEAIHTSTFLGHPVGCAMALAQIKELRRGQLPARSARIGAQLLRELKTWPTTFGDISVTVRAIGLLAGIELTRRDGSVASDVALRWVKRLLRRGIIVLPEGEHGEVVSLTPPLTLPWTELSRALGILRAELEALTQPPLRRA